MYLGVDIGGTKTLVAVLDQNGVITEKTRFETARDYNQFLADTENALASLNTKDFQAGAAGIPVSNFDRKHGRAVNFGNLPWQNVSVAADLERITRCPMVAENDSKLAALSEAMLLQDQYEKVLYVTISTGIGIGLVVNGVIDTSIGDAGGRSILLDYKGTLTPWEDFASGRAIVEIYGKKASEINDVETWRTISRDLSKGFIHLIAIIQPEAIVIGGSIGTYFERYGKLLAEEIKRYEIPRVRLPDLRQAARPEEAVIYGCYDLAKQAYPHAEHAAVTV